jgi:hypothetical protein
MFLDRNGFLEDTLRGVAAGDPVVGAPVSSRA